MPRINGLEMLQLLKSENRLKEIPVVVMSIPSLDFVQQQIGQNKILHYISKSDSYRELIGLLDLIL